MAGFVLLGLLTIAGSIYVSILVVRQDRGRKHVQAEREHQRELDRQYSIRRVLDARCGEILRRAEAAVDAILTSTARAQDLLDPPVDERLLGEHVEAILATLERVANLQAKHRSIEGRQAGPMTAAVLKPQQEALAIVLQAAESRMLNLERYASSVKAVDRTYWDFIGAQKAERLNEPVRNLLADTVRDQLAIEELNRLTERAAMAEQAFYYSCQQANLAAEILALPNDEGF